jgi:hypothetical protein
MAFDLISEHPAPEKRARFCQDGIEQHFTEGAVMVAFAFHLLASVPGLKHASIHPDGEHGKRFDFTACLAGRGFRLVKPMGSTAYGGLYEADDGRSILINPKSGLGDVIADLDGASYFAECKGGIINTKHAGQVSRLRKGLAEAIGQLLVVPLLEGQKQFAVVPRTSATLTLAKRMAGRARAAGIEIMLVDQDGTVGAVS